MKLSKEVCIACVNKHRTTLIEEKKEVIDMPWTTADDGLWQSNIVICYNNISNPTDTIPNWCPNDEIHRAMCKEVPNTIDEEEEEILALPVVEKKEENRIKSQNKKRRLKNKDKTKEIEDDDDLKDLIEGL